ncbi:unnamed protein product [Gongylonema pulchrum]|uniref:Selenoprotein T n=1 Tax=Gongylonema pulchrum TaxID=637853 RepID=A0A183DTN6_9BILA|nr:unnamed protein product [Gongylonema pulchrum]
MITNQIGTVILGVALLLSLRDIYGRHSNDDDSDDDAAAFKDEFGDEVIGLGKIAAIVLIVMGQDPFASVGRPTPRIFAWALNNKLSSCMMLFLLSNTIESSLMSTGAFEIYLGDEQIWSKLESGRVPSPTELLQVIDQHMELQGAKVGSLNQ